MLLYDELESNIMFFDGFHVCPLLWLGLQVYSISLLHDPTSCSFLGAIF